jgi:hypothetical protein
VGDLGVLLQASGREVAVHVTLEGPESISRLLQVLDKRYQSPLGWLTVHGWTEADTAALRGRLRG